MYLCVDADGPGIHRSGSRQKPVRVDFLAKGVDYRRRFGGGFREPLARAVGVSGKHKPAVLDTTAGLGRDSFVLASLGCEVTMLERAPVMAALLADALERASQDLQVAPTIQRMRLVRGDAVDWLNDRQHPRHEVIYIDPMFPTRRKSALVKGDMQLLHELVGTDQDVSELLTLALAQRTARVVVKRPRVGETTGERDPDFVLRGRSSRFDVYLPRAV